MARVKCKVCINEEDSFCLVKKVGIKLNKSRKCATYVHDETKVKVKQEIPTIKFGYLEQEEHKKKMKKELKTLKTTMKQQLKTNTVTDLEKDAAMGSNTRHDNTQFVSPGNNQKYPLTGDLRRFITTAAKGE